MTVAKSFKCMASQLGTLALGQALGVLPQQPVGMIVSHVKMSGFKFWLPLLANQIPGRQQRWLKGPCRPCGPPGSSFQFPAQPSPGHRRHLRSDYADRGSFCQVVGLSLIHSPSPSFSHSHSLLKSKPLRRGKNTDAKLVSHPCSATFELCHLRQ